MRSKSQLRPTTLKRHAHTRSHACSASALLLFLRLRLCACECCSLSLFLLQHALHPLYGRAAELRRLARASLISFSLEMLSFGPVS